MLKTFSVQELVASGTPPPASDEPALVRRIERHGALPQADRDALIKILCANVRTLQPRTALAEAGAILSEVSVVLDGWACSFSHIGGRRQIVALHLPGDICNLDAFLLGRSDQTIASLSRVRVAGIGRSTLNLLARRCPKVSHGLLRASAEAAATQRRWTLNVGQRGAKERLAFLLYDIWRRFQAIEHNGVGEVDLPLSQPDLADACGLTPEHTNRTLQELRRLDLLTLDGQRLRLNDLDGVRMLAGIDAMNAPLGI